MFSQRGVLLTFVSLIWLATCLPALGDQREKNRWFEIKIKTDTLKAKYFDAFIAIPKDNNRLQALCAALPDSSVWFSRDGYGQTWVRTVGLEKIKVGQLIRHQIRGNDVLFASTHDGLYQLLVDSLKWKKIGEQWTYGPMTAVCMGVSSDSAIYATSRGEVFKLSSSDGSWRPYRFSTNSKKFNGAISALLVSPYFADQFIVGTNVGIYTVRVGGDSITWPDTCWGESPRGVIAFATGNLTRWGRTMLAITESQGAFYSVDTTGATWWPMNNGLRNYRWFFSKRKWPALSGLSLDSEQMTKVGFVTSKRKKVLRINFFGIRVGFFELHTSNMMPSEVRRFSERFFHRLAVPEIVELTRIESKPIDSRDTLQALLRRNPDLRSYDLLIWGKIGKDFSLDYSEEIKIDMSVQRSSSDTSYSASTGKPEKYYPRLADHLAKQIKKREFKVQDPSLTNQFLWRGRRKYFTIATALGLSAHLLIEIIDKDKHQPGRSRLPLPPKFP